MSLSKWSALIVVVISCGAPTVEMSIPDPFDGLVVPSQVASRIDVSIYAQLDGGEAVFATEQSYVLGDEYPAQVTLTPTGVVFVAAAGCSYAKVPVVRWSALSEVTGNAATLALDAGALSVHLEREGTVTALLVGEFTGVSCNVGGVTYETLPLRHRLTLRVHRVGGFVVEHSNQLWPGCKGPALVAPAGIELPFPRVHPVDLAGVELRAQNAPRPATLRLRSPTGGLLGTQTGWRFRPGVGRVEVVVDTPLPVKGLKVFELVGASSLTSVEGSLLLTLTASKGFVSQAIEDGKSYRVYFPDEPNTVDVKVASVVTGSGPLCAEVPASWFAATTSTPEQCTPTPLAAAEAMARPAVASVVAAGECRVEVALPGTGFRWAAAFSTTR